MILKNISNKEQLVNTINWKEIVKAWAEFETDKWEQLLKMYFNLFEEVKQVPKVNETKSESKKGK